MAFLAVPCFDYLTEQVMFTVLTKVMVKSGASIDVGPTV